MPSARQRKRRTEQRAQERESEPQQTDWVESDRQWIDRELTEIQQLAVDLERRRQVMAEAQDLWNDRMQQQQSQRDIQGNTLGSGRRIYRGAPANTTIDSTGNTGNTSHDSMVAGQTRRTARQSRPRVTDIGYSQDGSEYAELTRQAMHTGGQQQQQQQSQHRPQTRSRQQQRATKQTLQQTTTKAMNELLQLLELQDPPIEPAARKLFEAQVLAKVKRILKSQKQRQTRRTKSKYYKRNRC
jgi:hypothetical protein